MSGADERLDSGPAPDSPRDTTAPSAPGPQGGQLPAGNRAVLTTGIVAVGVLLAIVVGTLALRPPPAQEPASVDVLLGEAQADADGVVPLEERIGTEVQAPLPDEELAAFGDGPARATSDYRGTPLIVNFWASWCGPCIEEMPDLDALADAADGRLAVLGVNRADDPTAARELVDELGITYDLAVDADDSLFADIEAFGMPTTLFVDADGTIVHRRTGALTAEEFAGTVTRELGVDIPAAG